MSIRLIEIPEYRKILELKKEIPPQRALVGTKTGWEEDPNLRSTEIRFIKKDEFPWVFDLMQNYARVVQRDLGIDIALYIRDHIQLSTYKPGDFYGWHVDGRILSCSLLLSSDFKGGRLQFKEPSPLLREEGKAIFFKGDQLHRVRPVIKGERDSLVVWWK